MQDDKFTLSMLHGLAFELHIRTGRAYRIEELDGYVRVFEDDNDLFCLGYLTKEVLHRMLYAMLIGISRGKQ